MGKERDSVIKRTVGRPPKGKSASGQPVPISKYPKLTIYMPGVLRAQLRAVAVMQRKPVWEVVNEAVESYIRNLSKEQRQVLESLGKFFRGEMP